MESDEGQVSERGDPGGEGALVQLRSHHHGLSHIADSKAAQGREVRKGLHAHRLRGLQEDNTGVVGFDECRISFSSLPSNIRIGCNNTRLHYF